MTQNQALAQPRYSNREAAETARQAGSNDASEAKRYRIWTDDDHSFSTFRTSPIHHNFHEHPMLQLPQLEQLAHELLPAGLCRFLVPGTTQASEFLHEPKSFDGRSIDEVFRHLEEPGSWIALYDIETIPRYREFLEVVMETVRPLVAREQPEVILMTGFIFISAPPSVTPFHIDRENNFWLQLRGRKSLTVWDREDREIVPAKDIEEFIVFRSLERVRLKDQFLARGTEMDKGPGDGQYFPSTTPHMTGSTTAWAKPGDGVAISIGINFYTNVTRRHALVHQINRVMRKFGMNPTPPGKSLWLDTLKVPLGKAIIAIQKYRKNYVCPPGAC